MTRTKQAARKSTGGKAPRMQLASPAPRKKLKVAHHEEKIATTQELKIKEVTNNVTPEKTNHEEEPSATTLDETLVASFFDKLQHAKDERWDCPGKEVVAMIEKNPELLKARSKAGETAMEMFCEDLTGYTKELITELVELGAKATENCYKQVMDEEFGVGDFLKVFLLSGYYPPNCCFLDEIASWLLEDEAGEMYLAEVMQILYKVLEKDDNVGTGPLSQVMIDNIASLPELEVGVTHREGGPMEEVMEMYPLEKAKGDGCCCAESSDDEEEMATTQKSTTSSEDVSNKETTTPRNNKKEKPKERKNLEMMTSSEDVSNKETTTPRNNKKEKPKERKNLEMIGGALSLQQVEATLLQAIDNAPSKCLKAGQLGQVFSDKYGKFKDSRGNLGFKKFTLMVKSFPSLVLVDQNKTDPVFARANHHNLQPPQVLKTGEHNLL